MLEKETGEVMNEWQLNIQIEKKLMVIRDWLRTRQRMWVELIYQVKEMCGPNRCQPREADPWAERKGGMIKWEERVQFVCIWLLTSWISIIDRVETCWTDGQVRLKMRRFSWRSWLSWVEGNWQSQAICSWFDCVQESKPWMGEFLTKPMIMKFEVRFTVLDWWPGGWLKVDYHLNYYSNIMRYLQDSCSDQIIKPFVFFLSRLWVWIGECLVMLVSFCSKNADEWMDEREGKRWKSRPVDQLIWLPSITHT